MEQLPAKLSNIIIRLEDRLRPNIGFTLRGDSAVFMRSAITLPKVNQFGSNLEHSEYIVGGWPWQIFQRNPNNSDSLIQRERRNFVVVFLSGKLRTISPRWIQKTHVGS